MTLFEIITEVKHLPATQRKLLLDMLIDSLTEGDPVPKKPRSLLEFRGVGSRLRDIDAQDYVKMSSIFDQ